MNTLSRRQALVLAAFLLPGMSVNAADYPAGPVRLMVPYPPGAATDTLARQLAQALEKELGATFVVENKGGAATQIGTRAVAEAKPDGQVLGFIDTAFVINPGLFGAALPYDTLRDFIPISQMATAPLVFVVHSAVPAKTMQEFVALAKADPGKIGFGSAGPGSAPHLAGEQLRMAAGIDITHIAYRGGSTVINDLIGGHIQCGFTTVPTMAEHIRAGTVRALMVTSPERSAQLPAVPTSREVGMPDVDLMPLFGLVAPARTPASTVARLSEIASGLVKSGELGRRLQASGFIPVGSTSEQFAARVRSEVAKWNQIISERKIRPNT
ncbi:Bug family tripartite tricarboxylate transporter substrate binding protein [Hydrogenophaga sp.]|uniref:Bug family tripartite tricarboxylate transporter substrate binding protein n=1 Tax=Hydrogenophaga sp. TaxID=1904254 RepID=UPI002FCC008A